MNKQPWSGLIFAAAVFSLVLPFGAANLASTSEPWPALLSEAPESIDPNVEALQLRARELLEKLALPSDSFE